MVGGVLACVCVSLLLFTPGEGHQVRGVPPELQHKYSAPGATFACLSGDGHTVPASSVNDDFCDCADGSDEPGTAACENGQFYCQNRGHVPRVLASTFVDDGVCDCCDGSDEAEGCGNTCAELGKEYRSELEDKLKVAQAGLKKKEERIAEGVALKKVWEEEVARLTKDVEAQKQVVEVARAAKLEHERLEREEAEKRRQMEEEEEARLKSEGGDEDAPPPGEESSEDEVAEKSDQPEQESEQTEGSESLGDSGGNGWDEAVGDASRGAPGLESDVQQGALDADNQEGVLDVQEGGQQPVGQGEKMDQPSAKEAGVHAQGEEQGEGYQVKDEPDVGYEGEEQDVGYGVDEQEMGYDEDEQEEGELHDYEDVHGWSNDGAEDDIGDGDDDDDVEEEQEEESNENDQTSESDSGLKRIFGSVSTWVSQVKDSVLGKGEGSSSKPVTRAKKSHGSNDFSTKLSSAEADLRDLESQLKDFQDKLGRDYGPSGEYITLDGQCVEKEADGYKYELCPFAQAKQFEHSLSTGLGAWHGFDESYEWMIFTGGKRCWHGPDRSLRVQLLCGDGDEFISVQEPNTCEYIGVFKTPSFCTHEQVVGIQKELESLMEESIDKRYEL